MWHDTFHEFLKFLNIYFRVYNRKLKNWQIPHAEECQKIYNRYSALKEMERSSPQHKYRIVTSFQRGKGKEYKHYFIKWTRSTSTMISQVNSIYPWYAVMMALCLCDLPPKSPVSLWGKKKVSQTTQWHYTKYLTSTLQDHQDLQKQGKSKKLS